MGVKVTRNVAFSAVRLFLLAPLPFVVIPFFLKRLGTSGYGTWSVFLAISGVTSLADVGLVTTLSKHVAEFYPIKDFHSLNKFISTGLALYVGLALLLGGILYFCSPFLLSTLFHGSPVPLPELKVLWRLLISLVAANILTMLFSSILIGLQRMDLSTTVSSAGVLLSAGLSILFLKWNWGLRGILYAYVLAAWGISFAYIFLVRQLLPEVTLCAAACQLSVAKEILGFSLKTYITQVAVVVHNQTEKIYLAQFVGVASVGMYDIASDLALKLRGIPGIVLAPIMPAASELHALADSGRLNELYLRAHKYLAFIGIPMVSFVVFVSKKFVQLWVGPSLSVIAIPLSILLVVNFINLTTGPGLLILVGSGELKPGVQSALLGVVLNVVLSLFLIRAYGFHGAIIGTSLSMVIASIFFLYRFHQKTRGAYRDVVRLAYLKPVLCSLTICGILWFAMRTVRPSWGSLALQAVTFGATYFLLLLLLGFFDMADLGIVETFLPVPPILRSMIPNAKLGSALLPHSEGVKGTAV